MKRLILVLGIGLLSIVALRTVIGLRTGPDLPVLGAVPAFDLENQDGETFSSNALRDLTWIGAFVYTTCPGPCPRVVETLSNVDRRLSHDPRVRIVAFSVDPANDTPDNLAAYARARGLDANRWTLLTGDVDTMYTLIRTGFKLGLEQNEGEDVAALGPIVHSVHAVLVDPGLQIRGYYDTTDPEAMKRLVADAQGLAKAAVR